MDEQKNRTQILTKATFNGIASRRVTPAGHAARQQSASLLTFAGAWLHTLLLLVAVCHEERTIQ
jgi:hypothetical protein